MVFGGLHRTIAHSPAPMNNIDLQGKVTVQCVQISCLHFDRHPLRYQRLLNDGNRRPLPFYRSNDRKRQTIGLPESVPNAPVMTASQPASPGTASAHGVSLWIRSIADVGRSTPGLTRVENSAKSNGPLEFTRNLTPSRMCLLDFAQFARA